MRHLPPKRPGGPLPSLSSAEAALKEALRRDVLALADGIGERHLGRPAALERSAALIESRLTAAGLAVAVETFSVGGKRCRNLVADLGPPAPRLLVGAHYDTVPGSPGADDNATGVAALLALADHFGGQEAPPPLRLAAFVNEEPPYFQSEAMGSRVHARSCKEAGVPLTGAVALDGLGYYSDRPGSQGYPLPDAEPLTDVGEFLGFVANEASAGLLEDLLVAFRGQTSLPAQGAILPEWAPGTGWSDHWAFWQEGWPGVMVTDTLPYRHPGYHGPGDTIEQLDFDRLARAGSGLIGAIEELAATTR